MKRVVLIVVALLTTMPAFSQQELFRDGNIISPELNSDGSVTFRLHAPKAVEVTLTSDCLPSVLFESSMGILEGPGSVKLTEKANGIWEYTTPEKVAPDFYTYYFTIDGVRAIDHNNVFINRDVASISNILLIPETGARSDLYAIHDVPHGTVSKVWYHSDKVGFDRRMSVYTPAGYEDSKKKYPVLYVLHGVGGDEDAWLTQGRAAQVLDNLIARGEAEPMIAVFTNGNMSQEAAPYENSTGYIHPTTDLPMQMEGTFETAFPEIVNYIDSHYRTIKSKNGRAVCGLSMGGFHTLNLSINYPDMFNWSGMFSAGIKVTPPEVSPMYQNFDQKLATYFEKKPKLLWIGCGTGDFLYQMNISFVKELEEKGYPFTYVETDGGHVWRNWRRYFTEFVPLIFK